MSEQERAQGTYHGPSPRQPVATGPHLTGGAAGWLVAGLALLIIAALGGLVMAYVVASMRAAPPPDAAFMPTPTATASPTPSPTATDSPTVPPTATPSPSPSQPTAAPTPSPTPLEYVVQRGDTINKIALRFGVTPESIIELNELRNPNLIVPGQLLLIPAGGTPSPPP
ncbi:MAG TPA: LysM peptidoglycan-binding domain-containing protein [Candidatus Limnocylindrales bacterium]